MSLMNKEIIFIINYYRENTFIINYYRENTFIINYYRENTFIINYYRENTFIINDYRENTAKWEPTILPAEYLQLQYSSGRQQAKLLIQDMVGGGGGRALMGKAATSLPLSKVLDDLCYCASVVQPRHALCLAD